MKRTPLLFAAVVMAVVVVGPNLPVPAVAAEASAAKQICDPNADFFLGVENYPEAIRLHRDHLAKLPDDALAHYHLGFAYGMLGDKSAELREYEQAAALGLTHWDLFLNLGLAEFDRGNLDAARDALQVAVLLGPGQPQAHFNLGLVYERQGVLAQAEQQMLAALVLDPAQPDARNMLGVIYARRGDEAGAARQWRALLHDVPDYKPARVNLALLERKLPAAAWDAPHEPRNVAFTFGSHAAR